MSLSFKSEAKQASPSEMVEILLRLKFTIPPMHKKLSKQKFP